MRDDVIQGTYQGVLAMTVGDEPYAVPLNHAYREGRFYFHCASSGRKLDAIRQNPSVAYVIKKYYGDSAELARSMKCHGHWESVIAYGRARVVSEERGLIRTFRIFMAYYGQEDYQHGEELLTKQERHRHRRRPHVRTARVRRLQDGLLDLGAGRRRRSGAVRLSVDALGERGVAHPRPTARAPPVDLRQQRRLIEVREAALVERPRDRR